MGRRSRASRAWSGRPGLVVLLVVLLAGSLSAAWLLHGGSATATPERRLFQRDCQGCHALAGSRIAPSSGGDLAGYRIGLRQLEQFTREMPARPPLGPADIVAVSRYVASLERATAAHAAVARSSP